MKLLHIDSIENVNKIDNLVKQGNDVFILVYMVGCGPCNAVRPEWAKLGSSMKMQYPNNKKLVIIDVNKDYLPEIKTIGEVDGFPTIKYISNRGELIESYEDSSITKKDRSVDSFIDWVESKILNGKVISLTPTSSPLDLYNRIKPISKRKQTNKKKTTKRKQQKGGKWTKKYKMSINCRKPKGFSQRQYCKYGRKK
jgi:thiol-disulfide isomerase/thioredoxin